MGRNYFKTWCSDNFVHWTVEGVCFVSTPWWFRAHAVWGTLCSSFGRYKSVKIHQLDSRITLCFHCAHSVSNSIGMTLRIFFNKICFLGVLRCEIVISEHENGTITVIVLWSAQITPGLYLNKTTSNFSFELFVSLLSKLHTKRPIHIWFWTFTLPFLFLSNRK